MGQRGLQTYGMGGFNYYWQTFYSIGRRNFNWVHQCSIVSLFCNYFCIWVLSVSKFFFKFLSLGVGNFCTLTYYHRFYKLRNRRLRFMGIWFIRTFIFRYDFWLVFFIEYYCKRPPSPKKFKILKKMRSFVLK